MFLHFDNCKSIKKITVHLQPQCGTFVLLPQELDSLYEQDHRTQKHLNELEDSVEQIKSVLEREENDRESRLGLKLE